jgi:arylsulfatase A-like enzyme
MVANDLRLRKSETTIAEILAAQDYRTSFIGKRHLDGGKLLPGFVKPGPRRQGFAVLSSVEFWQNSTQFRLSIWRVETYRVLRFQPDGPTSSDDQRTCSRRSAHPWTHL